MRFEDEKKMSDYLAKSGQEAVSEALSLFLGEANSQEEFTGYSTPGAFGFTKGSAALHVTGGKFRLEVEGQDSLEGSWEDFKLAQGVAGDPTKVEFLADDVQRKAMAEALEAVKEENT